MCASQVPGALPHTSQVLPDLIFQRSYNINTISNPNFRMRKQRLEQVNPLVMGHPAMEGRRFKPRQGGL